ncbi:serine hydrolase domain-containing protein [Paenibacillus phocaensis]|uniref:serine hydrolase domain-containing protein n=1 Tax=Paenibacillus phocaensis TaxID=1776378 RepID=UPI0003A6F904|nr:serine hydrolase [Paenibacillus phocaensis]
MLPLNDLIIRIQAQQLNISNILIRQHGVPVGRLEFSKDQRRLQHSVSKSFTCIAIGMAIHEGKLSLSTKLGDVFPEYKALPRDECTHFAEEITLLHLLTMSSGHDTGPLSYEERAHLTERDWVKHYMSLPLDHAPGARFIYSSGDTFMLSAVLQAATGETVRDYLMPRLFEPLDMQDIQWDTCPLGRTLGCTGLYISTEELSRFGQFLLQQGAWNGQQLVPANWISFVTSKKMDTAGSADWNQGYGAQFWRCTHDAFRADGMYGQFCIVIPHHQAVIAVNSHEERMQEILDVIWSEIYPLL